MSRMRRRLLTLLIVSVGGTLSGCDVLLNLFPTTNNETGKAQLVPFESEKAYSDYMRNQIERRNDSINSLDRLFTVGVGGEAIAVDAGSAGGADSAAPSAPDADGGSLTSSADGSGLSFSGTTIQEVGVDEADVVKTDGHYLYVLTPEGSNSVLRIVDVSDPAALVEVGRAELDGFGQDIYLHGDMVIALTSSGGGFFALAGGGGIAIDAIAVEPVNAPATGSIDGDVAAIDSGGAMQTLPVDATGKPDAQDGSGDAGGGSVEPGIGGTDGFIAPDYSFERPTITVSVVDVSDRTDPVIDSTTRFDGTMASSRMIDGVLYLVAANYQDYYVDVLPLLGTPDLQPTAIDTSTLLPRFTRADSGGVETTGDVLTWESLFHPIDPDGFGVVYVASIDIDNDATFSAVGVVAEPGLVYSSLDALYLTDTEYDFAGSRRTTTDVYKFAYADRTAKAVAAGSVSGRILNQYSMSEYNGFLRVATTVDATFGPFGQRTPPTNHVFVLSQAGSALDVVGSVEGIAPRETIQSARFVGDKGFVVTFEQIDPLFTIDLSDPTNPRVAGELEVPGFSTFLVPIDENHLLAVGQHVPPPGMFGPWGVQLSIFDVTDFDRPQLMDRVTIGDDTGASSEAIYNPKAFTYFAQRGTVALPISINNSFFTFADDAIMIDANDAGTSTGSGGVTAPGGPVDGVDAPPPPDAVIEDPGDAGLVGIDPFVPDGFEGLVVYDVSLETGLTERGRISTRFPEAGIFWSSYTRGVFIDDDVLAVTDNGVRGAPVNAMETDPFELLFDRSFGEGKGGIAVEGPPTEVSAPDETGTDASASGETGLP